jgi:thioester reductase-like protein
VLGPRQRSDRGPRTRSSDHGGRTDVKVVHGDITKPRCGLGASDCQLLFGRINRVVHCAASLNFQDKEETNLTNVTGLQHVLELMDLLDTRGF